MPRKAKELTALDVKRLVHPGSGGNVMKPVGGVDGLYLQITPSNARSWILRTSIAGQRHKMGLGPYPEVSLADARRSAAQARSSIRLGENPLLERKAARAALRTAKARSLLFADAVEQYLDTKLDEFSNAKHRQQWRSTLMNYANPVIGQMMVSEITTQDVLRVLEPMWKDKTETASRLRGRIEAVLSWATVAGHRTGENPAIWKGHLEAILPKPNKLAKKEHHPALKISEAPEWFADVCSRDGTGAKALAFIALTAARSGEVRGMTWGEVDLDTSLWIVPAERMKTANEHRVPLSPQAIDLLRDLGRGSNGDLVFPAVKGGQLTDAALSACMKRIAAAKPGYYLDATSKRPAVPHGLRSTFKDWTAERGYPSDMSEIALAHKVGSAVERAYRRTDMLERRRDMMASWSQFLRGETVGNVVSLNA
ncbi:integrase [Marivita geojedonensis]|uniref:Integrase n=2 Tax=Marivita geojedonensis TaxID=1123756 RepID=A0A1X4ND58_9RHOB|nr:integrase arm-type DNA-binding domain-containing protein [Marivita geojedonensis]OSQ44671.1 integrase [Marivita geojedonensis]PRY76389.1 integrase [Marivita geojedonensis]